MTDTIQDPDGSASANGQQSGGSQTQQPSGVPAGYVEKARLDGALQKIQELTLANRSLTDQVAQLQQASGSAQASYTEKEAALQAAVGEKASTVASLQAEVKKLQAQISRADALALKLKVIDAVGTPELYRIIDTIPDTTDEEALKASVTKLASFAKSMVKDREAQLLAGVLPHENQPTGNIGEQLPADEAGWMKKIEGLPLGSAQRQEAWDAYYKATFKK